VRLAHLLEQDHCLQERMRVYKQRRDELWIQVLPFEAAGRTEERDYFPVKAQHLAADWEVRRCTAKLEKNAVRRQSQMNKGEHSCQELRQLLRQQEDLEAQARDMDELDHTKDQLMTLFKVGLANVGSVGAGSVFWRELPALWVATLVALLQAGWVGHHDNQRGAARILCL